MFFWMGRKMNRRLKTTGFTIVELLTVIAVLAILVGILMPALNQVKKMARETKQKSQIHSIDIGLNVYKNDQGDYPPSTDITSQPSKYCGSQLLSEAMFGYDLLGFHPKSLYEFDNISNIYQDTDNNLKQRKGPYLDRSNISLFTPKQIFDPAALFGGIKPERHLICDVFTSVNRTITLPNGDDRTVKVGTPVLYFKADTSQNKIDDGDHANSIYDIYDNLLLIELGKISNKGTGNDIFHEDFVKGGTDYKPFYDYITDPLIPTPQRPVRPDTFLLISAGYDGLYGTSDDICNFEPNIE